MLYFSAEHEESSAAPAARAFILVTPAAVKQLDLVAGAVHGTALLAPPAVVASVGAFWTRHDR